MPVEVILPKVDMDMTHGTLALWHVAEGGAVEKGAALFDIETDKAAMEVEAPATGHLHHIAASAGDKVAVGSVIAYIYAVGEAVGPAPTVQPEPAEIRAETAAVVKTDAPQAGAPKPVADLAGGVRATPAARAAARRAGIALGDVTGTGPRGRIQRDDIAQAVVPDPALPPPAIWTPEPGALHISRRAGEGIPLLMIHGFTADSQSWAPLEKALPQGLPLIRIDLPGHGRSPKRRIASFAEMLRMLVDAFDDATRAHETVHLLGHSLGGALALGVADIRARKLASLSLLAPAGLGPEIDAATLAGIVRASRAISLMPWLQRLTATPEGISEDYAKAAMRPRADPKLRAAQASMAEALFPDAVQAFDLRPALGRLTLPTSLIWGRQDHILPYRHATGTPSDAAVHLLQGAGHVPHLECPERVAQIITRHIRADM
jgi:pimeloyl-ACP methyl ester carboxylesterase